LRYLRSIFALFAFDEFAVGFCRRTIGESLPEVAPFRRLSHARIICHLAAGLNMNGTWPSRRRNLRQKTRYFPYLPQRKLPCIAISLVAGDNELTQANMVQGRPATYLNVHGHGI
jgi:hypothetical protein